MENKKETGIGTDSGATGQSSLDKSDTMALKILLEKRLSDCGWRQIIQQLIRDTIWECGPQNITHEQLAALVMPSARALVPDAVRKEMLIRVRQALQSPLHQ